MVKHLSAMQETWVQSLGQEDPLEKEMATHSSTLTWKIPGTWKPGRLQSMGFKESDTTERLLFLEIQRSLLPPFILPSVYSVFCLSINILLKMKKCSLSSQKSFNLVSNSEK